MSFDDLPHDWPSIPLTDPDHIANVLDLFVSMEARHRGALLILICDEERRPVQPVQIDDIPACPPADAPVFLRRFAEAIGTRPGAGALFAVARYRKLRVTANDRAWAQAIRTAFDGRAEVFGVHVVTTGGSLPVDSPESASRIAV